MTSKSWGFPADMKTKSEVKWEKVLTYARDCLTQRKSDTKKIVSDYSSAALSDTECTIAILPACSLIRPKRGHSTQRDRSHWSAYLQLMHSACDVHWQ